MVEVGNSNEEVSLGLDRDIKRDEGIRDLDIFRGVKNNYKTISIQLVKVKGNKILKFSEEDIEFLNRWIFKNSYKPLETDKGLVYFVLFKKITGKFLAGGDYLNLELESLPTAYTPIMVNHNTVSGSKILEIKNITTVRENTSLDFHVNMIEGNSLYVTNLHTGKKFTIDNLVDNEEFYVYGELHRVISQIDGKRNLYKLCNRVFDLDLLYGKNKIKVECLKKDGSAGRCEIEIMHQSKMAYQ